MRVNCGEYEKESVCQVKVALAFPLGFCFVTSSQSARLGALKRQASMPRENWDQIQTKAPPTQTSLKLPYLLPEVQTTWEPPTPSSHSMMHRRRLALGTMANI